MSMQNRISETIPANVLNDVTIWTNNIVNALKPYMVALTGQDRRELFKMGDKSVGYLEKVKSYLATAPQFVPPYMDVAEFTRDVSLVSDVQPVYQLLAALLDDLDDTRMLAGSEAMEAARLYYANVKTAAKANVPNAKTIYEDLSSRFPRKARNTTTDSKPE